MMARGPETNGDPPAANPDLDRDPATIRCPTCRASQEWSDTCRRCKSDLRLLRAFATAYQHTRRDCLQAIQRGDAQAATRHAQRAHALHPSASTRRLQALAALLRHDGPAAAHWACLALRDQTP